MNQEDLYTGLISIVRQNVYIIVCTKLQFQRVICRLFGQHRFNAIYSSINPFILPFRRYDHNLDVFIFILFWFFFWNWLIIGTTWGLKVHVLISIVNNQCGVWAISYWFEVKNLTNIKALYMTIKNTNLVKVL